MHRRIQAKATPPGYHPFATAPVPTSERPPSLPDTPRVSCPARYRGASFSVPWLLFYPTAVRSRAVAPLPAPGTTGRSGRADEACPSRPPAPLGLVTFHSQPFPSAVLQPVPSRRSPSCRQTSGRSHGSANYPYLLLRWHEPQAVSSVPVRPPDKPVIASSRHNPLPLWTTTGRSQLLNLPMPDRAPPLFFTATCSPPRLRTRVVRKATRAPVVQHAEWLGILEHGGAGVGLCRLGRARARSRAYI